MKKNKLIIDKLYNLKVPKGKKSNLPAFYNFVIFNYFGNERGKIQPQYHYSEKLSCYINYSIPEKPISKIIDYEKEQIV